MRITFWIVLFFSLLFLACSDRVKTVEVVKQTYKNGQNEVVWVYEINKNDSAKVKEIEYFENGNLHIETFFDSSGQRIGTWKSYYDNGQIWSQHNYENGKLNGEYTTWYKDGKVYLKGQYKDGKEIGTWNYYNEKGALVHQASY